MKKYNALRPLVVMTTDGFTLPKGNESNHIKPQENENIKEEINRGGYGNIVFLVSPTRKDTYQTLSSPFVNYKVGLYRHYLIDFIYKEKIGFKKYVANNTGVFRKEFEKTSFDGQLSLVSNSNKVNILKRKLNLLVDLGEWNSIYFQFQVKSSLEKICENYLSFLSKRINNPDFSDYKKILYIDADQWITERKKLSLNRKDLNNPIAILLVTLYKYPELISKLYGCEIVIADTLSHKVMRLTEEDLINKKYSKIKQKIMSMLPVAYIDDKNMDESSTLNETPGDKPLIEMTPEELAAKITESPEKKKKEKIRSKILGELTKNLLGENIEDITTDILLDEEPDEGDIETDDEEINEIKNIANNYLDEHPELLEDDNTTVSVKEVTDEVKKRYYIHEYKPKYTDKQLKKIQELTETQDSVIGNLDESIKDLESKKISTTDFSDVVSSTNVNVTQSKFVNMDREYTEKKLQKDIDNAVGQLANATTKVFITNKEEVDSSDPMNLKKTLIYHLQDENGKKMTLKFDVPIIFEDHYMYIKGNKKVIQHIFNLKPLVKTGKDSVQLVTNYQKMFFSLSKSLDLKTNALLRFILSNKNELNVVMGNGIAVNKKYKTTREYSMISKKVIQFQIDQYFFILDTVKLEEVLKREKISFKNVDPSKEIIIGFDTKEKKLIKLKNDESFSDKIFQYLPEEYMDSIKKIGRKSNGGKLLLYTQTKPLTTDVPLALLLFYFEGFHTVMEKAKIEYEIIPKDGNKIYFDIFDWGYTELADGYIKWKRYPFENSLLMNGLNSLPIHTHSIEDLESKDTYMYLLTNLYDYANQSFNLD